MGLAASQARLLSLTARMHDIEYKAQKLEAQKLQMANQSQKVYEEYEEALNKTKIQYKTIGADGSANYKDATLRALVTATGEAKSDYIAHNIATNQMYCTQAQIDRFTAAGMNGTDDEAKAFAEAMGYAESASYQSLYKEMYQCYVAHGNNTDEAFIAVDGTANGVGSNPTPEEAAQFNNAEYLTNMINAGFIVLHKLTGDGITSAADEVNVATDTALQEVSDEVDLKKAEAKYEADMRKINTKDKKYDVDIAALEQERNAIKTEMETLKTVAKDNVERTFKLFS